MKKIVNVLIIIGYLWLTVIMLYNTVLPAQYKDLIPQFTNLPFLLSATFAGVLSSALLYMKQFTNKQNETNVNALLNFNDKLKDFDSTIFKLESLVNGQNGNLNTLNTENEKKSVKYDEIIKLLEKNNRLAQVELESRITNPLIDNNIKVKIKELLDNEKKNIL